MGIIMKNDEDYTSGVFVDTELSENSDNPVANKTVATAVNQLNSKFDDTFVMIDSNYGGLNYGNFIALDKKNKILKVNVHFSVLNNGQVLTDGIRDVLKEYTPKTSRIIFGTGMLLDNRAILTDLIIDPVADKILVQHGVDQNIYNCTYNGEVYLGD